MRCEERFWNSGKPCTHEAKYLVTSWPRVVCGIHNRAYLRSIPLAEIEGALAAAGTETPNA